MQTPPAGKIAAGAVLAAGLASLVLTAFGAGCFMGVGVFLTWFGVAALSKRPFLGCIGGFLLASLLGGIAVTISQQVFGIVPFGMD